MREKTDTHPAIAADTRRERVKDRIKGLEAELKMDMAQMDELLQQLR
jgi:hypothetical protein